MSVPGRQPHINSAGKLAVFAYEYPQSLVSFR